jgi:hypothetical protein
MQQQVLQCEFLRVCFFPVEEEAPTDLLEILLCLFFLLAASLSEWGFPFGKESSLL